MCNPILMYGTGPDFFYASAMEVPDPYALYVDSHNRKHMLLSALEVDRGRKVAKVHAVHAFSDVAAQLETAGQTPSLAAVLLHWVQQIEGELPSKIVVPYTFPTGLFHALRRLGMALEPKDGAVFPERAIKTVAEIEAIAHAQKVNEQGFFAAFDILKSAEIKADKSLHYKGTALTAEFLQSAINTEIVRLGGTGFNGGPIVACGALGADPHERGHGVLKAEELIVIDSFPQVGVYNGDLTRTVLVGEGSQWQHKLHAAVLAAQQAALDFIKAGVTGAACHAVAKDVLDKQGFTTGQDEQGRNYGFFHGLGHSLGLEVHDVGGGLSPRNPNPLEVNAVVTVEPGAYYPEKGGVRIEDIVVVEKSGCKNLTRLPKNLLVKEL